MFRIPELSDHRGFHTNFKESPRGQDLCGRVKMPAGLPEKIVHKAVKVKPELHWRPQDIGDSRAVECLPVSTTYRQLSQLKREKSIAVSKNRR